MKNERVERDGAENPTDEHDPDLDHNERNNAGQWPHAAGSARGSTS